MAARVAAAHVFQTASLEDADARHKDGHDGVAGRLTALIRMTLMLSLTAEPGAPGSGA
jgi:hypothetical protein